MRIPFVVAVATCLLCIFGCKNRDDDSTLSRKSQSEDPKVETARGPLSASSVDIDRSILKQTQDAKRTALFEETLYCAGMSALNYKFNPSESIKVSSQKWAWAAYLAGRLTGRSHDESYALTQASSEKYVLAGFREPAVTDSPNKLLSSLSMAIEDCLHSLESNPDISRSFRFAALIVDSLADRATLDRVSTSFSEASLP